jgi:hypothetical protein
VKKALIAVLVLLSIVLVATATEDKGLKFSEFSLDTGKSALASGLGASGRWESEKFRLLVVGNSDRYFGAFFLKFPAGLSVGVCTGAFKNQPQVGPYITFAPTKFLSAFYWRAWGFGKPNEPKLEVNSFFQCVGAAVTLGNVKVNCTWIDFMGTKALVPGVSYGIRLNDQCRLTFGAEYKVPTDEPLFSLKFSFFPKS